MRTDPFEALAALRERRRKQAAALSDTDADIDALLLDMTRTLPVARVAEAAGVTRQQVHRRIRRARARRS